VAVWLGLSLGRLTVRLHLLLPLAVALAFLVPGDLWLRYLLLLATLLVHELAHAVTALGLGGGRALVRVWPVFGRADVERFPDRRAALVALSAPALNLLCAGVLYLAGGRPTLALGSAPLLDFAHTVNLLMGLGNLLPVMPVDGGRALLALTTRGERRPHV
jgi:stage IV sporulation protein FB